MSAYQIKYSTTFDNLMDENFDSNLAVQFQPQDIIDGSVQPLESGSKQRVTLRLPSTAEDVTYYVALKATNKANVASNTSNVVSVQIARVKPPQTQPPTPRPTTTLAPETSTSVNTGMILKIPSEGDITWFPLLLIRMQWHVNEL